MLSNFLLQLKQKMHSGESRSDKPSDPVIPVYEDYVRYSDYHKIEENLYLGNISITDNHSIIKENGIKRVLTLNNEPIGLDFKVKNVDYKYIYAEDDPTFVLLIHFCQCIQYITDSLTSGQPVYVHCVAGVSRSATIVIAFLMSKYKKTYSEASDLVKSKRFISPNKGFIEQLVLFEEMKYTIDANNRKFRQFLIRNTRTSFEWSFNMELSFEKYFQILSLSEAMVKDLSLSQVFECLKCNYGLFNEINVIKNENSDQNRVKDTDVACDLIFIEPQKWMSKSFRKRNVAELDEGVVNCPECGVEIGCIDLIFSLFYCNCPLHVGLDCLMVKIFNQNVRKRVTQEVSD